MAFQQEKFRLFLKIADTVELKIGYELPGGYKCGLFVATRQYVTTNVNRTINKTPNILKTTKWTCRNVTNNTEPIESF